MLELPHTIAGLVIATKLNNPLIALPLAFISNFLLDMLPHWNPPLYTEIKQHGKISLKSKIIVFADTGLALITGFILAARFYPDFGKIIFILTSCFLAVSADVAEAPYFFLGSKNKYILRLISFQRKLQWNAPLIPGILSQIIFIGICLFFLLS